MPGRSPWEFGRLGMMELSDFAASVLHSPALEDKLAVPDELTDAEPTARVRIPLRPARATGMRFAGASERPVFPSGTAIDTALVGPKTFTVDAVDNAGLTATLTLTYNIEYVYEGPFPPLEEGGVYKLGRTIPVKFSLHDADGIYIGTAISRLYLRPEGGLEIEATSTSAATEGNLFRPVADDEQYIFNLATKPLSAGLWTMRIELDDGTSKYIDITLVDGPPGQGSDDADDSDNVNEGNNGKGKGK